MKVLTRRSLLLTGAGTLGAATLGHDRFLGTAQAPVRSASPRLFDVRSFGAVGDGRFDSRAAIQSAIDHAASTGGGTVVIPVGTWLVSKAPGRALAIALKSGVHLTGRGAGSVLKLSGASVQTGCHLVNIDQARDVAISDLTLDGSRDGARSSGHGIRCSSVDGLIIRNVLVRKASSYGIGLAGGANHRVDMDSVTIEDTGADGIDIKNRKNLSSPVRMTNVTVRRWGLRRDRETQAAIDCRGRVEAMQIRISEPGSPSAVGFRFRQGESGDVNGLGAHNSRLSNFAIMMGEGNRQIGLNVVARNIVIGSGTIARGARGIMIQDSGCRCTSVLVEDCADSGVIVDAHGKGLDGDSAILADCKVLNCGEDGIQVEADGVQLIRCVARGNAGRGMIIRPTASGTIVRGGDFSGNRAGAILDGGVGTIKLVH